jgi:hypothetical protein
MSRRHALLSLVLPVAGAAALPGGCDPGPAGSSAASQLAVRATSVDDGGPVSPTATLTVDLSSPPDPGSLAAVTLVRGPVDATLRKHIERGDVPAASQGDLVSIRVAAEGARILATPSAPLDGVTQFTLVVPSSVRAADGAVGRLPASELRAFSTLPSDAGRPWLQLLSPPGGALDVVRNLRAVEVRFSRAVEGVDDASLRVVGDDGEAIAARVSPAAATGGYLLELAAPLRPLRRYHVDAGEAVRDDAGGLVFALLDGAAGHRPPVPRRNVRRGGRPVRAPRALAHRALRRRRR